MKGAYRNKVLFPSFSTLLRAVDRVEQCTFPPAKAYWDIRVKERQVGIVLPDLTESSVADEVFLAVVFNGFDFFVSLSLPERRVYTIPRPAGGLDRLLEVRERIGTLKRGAEKLLQVKKWWESEKFLFNLEYTVFRQDYFWAGILAMHYIIHLNRAGMVDDAKALFVTWVASSVRPTPAFEEFLDDVTGGYLAELERVQTMSAC